MVALGRAAHRLLALVFGVIVLGLLGMGALAWRVSQGPVDITWLARRAAAAFAPGLSAGRVTLAIVGAGSGHAVRLDVTDGRRRAEEDEPADTVRHATVALALGPLLAGRLEPSELVLDGLRAHVMAGEAAEPGHPGLDPARLVSHLQRISVTDVQADIALGTLAQKLALNDLAAEATRDADGTLQGHVSATAVTGGMTVQVAAQGSDGPAGAQVDATIPALNPAVLARAIPSLAAAGALDTTASLHATARFGPDFALSHASLHVETGAGSIQLPAKGGGTSAGQFASLALDAEGTATDVTLHGLRLVLAPPSGNPPSTVVISGTAQRAAGRFTAHLAVAVDRLAFADLGAVWPAHVGGDARDWLTQNLTAGTAHDGHATLTLTGAETGDDIDLPQAEGSITGDDVTAWWLRPVPPLAHAHAVVAWQAPDVAVITATSAHQGAIEAKTGTVRITGLTGKDQVALIDADLAGPLGDVLALLKQPRLGLLSKHPIAAGAPGGAVTAHLSVRLPLEAKVTIDQVAIHANGQVANTHLGGIAAGRDLDRGQLAIDVTNDGLSLTGPADIGHVPAQLAVQMDFKDGPKTQVLQHVTAALHVTKADADRAGLGMIGLEAGALDATVDYAERRDSTAAIALDTDFTAARLVTPLGWSKAAGLPGHAEARAALDHGRLVGLDGVRAEAPGLAISARTELVNGRPSIVHLERGEIGRSSATGTIALPQREGEPYRITLAGPRLDLEGRLTSLNSPAAADTTTEPAKYGTPYAVDLRFDRVVLGPNHGLGPVSLMASGDGRRLTSARLSTGGQERARAELVAVGTGRRLTATAADFGSLLRDTDLATEVNGGELTVTGTFDDRAPGSPFNGMFDLRGFKVSGAPVAGKLLQALTVYGVVDALRGPGLAFDRFETPFRLHGSMLDVVDARAFSSSLGLTATGQFDFGRKLVDLRGTIVPAYFFNSLPGRIPLIGQMFSPEKGSGVFAANYSLHGPVADPAISINPLSALAPGFMRRFFDLFD